MNTFLKVYKCLNPKRDLDTQKKELVQVLKENSSLKRELNQLHLGTRSRREIIDIQRSNDISKLTEELNSFQIRNSKLEKEADHYKKIYRDLTDKYNREKSEHIFQKRKSQSVVNQESNHVSTQITKGSKEPIAALASRKQYFEESDFPKQSKTFGYESASGISLKK